MYVVDNTAWTVIHQPVPQQTNVVDCAIFVCNFMKCIVRNMTPCYEQSFMPYFRSYMMRELMAGRCFPEPLAVTATSDTDKEVQ